VPFRPRRIGDGKRGPARLSVNGTDRGLRARRSASTEQPASVGTSPCQPDLTSASLGKICPWKTCASNMNSKPWRAAAPGRCRDFFRLLTASARHCSGSVVRHWHARRARGSGCPLSRGYRRRLLVPPSLARFGAIRVRNRSAKAASALVPGTRGAISADVPDALTRHNRNLSPSACSS
jgi:hypothetical protein